jgi:hypothetical protein
MAVSLWPRCTICDGVARPDTICNRDDCPWNREKLDDGNLRITVLGRVRTEPGPSDE